MVSLPDFPLAEPYCSNHPPIIPQAAQVAPPFLSAKAAEKTNGKSFILSEGRGYLTSQKTVSEYESEVQMVNFSFRKINITF